MGVSCELADLAADAERSFSSDLKLEPKLGLVGQRLVKSGQFLVDSGNIRLRRIGSCLTFLGGSSAVIFDIVVRHG